MTTKSKEARPLLIIYVTPRGVVKTLVPYKTLAQERAGRDLEARCAPIIALLSECARRTAESIAPLTPPSESLIQS